MQAKQKMESAGKRAAQTSGLRKLLFVVALLVSALTAASPVRAQTTDVEKLSYLLLGGNYAVQNGYQPNGVHAGIDFKGTGTNVTEVRAPLDGTITANTSACGKVAIFDGANTVILAHMDSRIGLGIGATIKRGDYVGKAAQVVGGGCTATGPHLHIEVRTGNNPMMADPPANNTATTINPATMFRYNAWDFNTNGDFSGWAAINVESGSVNGGAFVINPQTSDPYFLGPYLSLNAATYKYVKLRLASCGTDSTGAIYFRTATEDFYSPDKMVTFTVNNCYLCSNAPYYDYSLYMGGNPKWTGRVTGVRLDPTGAGQTGTFADAIGLDYLYVQTVP